MVPKNQTRKVPKFSGTMKSVSMWHKAMYEKLGWMVLAKAKGYDYKIEPYKKSIDNLIKTIEHLMKEYENHNRKHDLNVLLMNTRVLQDFAAKHL
jgi:hypothetical protein